MGKRIELGFLAFLACAPLVAPAADIKLTPPAGASVVVTNAGGDTIRFRVNEQGDASFNGNFAFSPSTTETSGSILRGTTRFIHNYGVNNSFMGMGSGNYNMTGARNMGFGESSLSANTTGLENTGFGHSNLLQNTTGSYNTAVGTLALRDNGIGVFNTGVGYGALFRNEGTGNVALGHNAGRNLFSGNFNILIGNGGEDGESNTIRVGTATHSRAFIGGIRGKTTAGSAIAVMIDIDGQLGTISSSASTKDDIADMGEATDALMQLRPVTFHYKSDQDPAGRTLQYGLVAEEVAEVYPGLVARTRDGQAETVMYQFLPSMLLNEVQKQQRTIDTQASELEALRQRLARLERLLGRQP